MRPRFVVVGSILASAALLAIGALQSNKANEAEIARANASEEQVAPGRLFFESQFENLVDSEPVFEAETDCPELRNATFADFDIHKINEPHAYSEKRIRPRSEAVPFNRLPPKE